MKEPLNDLSNICFCASVGIRRKDHDKEIEQVKKIFSSGVEQKKKISVLGEFSVKRTYSVGKNEFKLNLVIMPSLNQINAKLNEIIIEKKGVSNETILEEKKKLEKYKVETDLLMKKLQDISKSSSSDEDTLFFMLRCETSEDEEFLRPETLWNFPSQVEKLLNIVERISPEFVPARSCLGFNYDTKNYKFVGGFTLPTKIPISQRIVDRLGEVDVTGIHLSFKESPLNINKIEIRQLLEGNIKILTNFSSKVRISKKIFQEAYKYGVQASSLFVEAKE